MQKSVSAFANTEGGHLIFGVKNEPREVVGLENPQAVVSRLTELIKVASTLHHAIECGRSK
ncbi:MAG: helix-turn-helix domain-containing protein [Faecalibacterium prausnitzii]